MCRNYTLGLACLVAFGAAACSKEPIAPPVKAASKAAPAPAAAKKDAEQNDAAGKPPATLAGQAVQMPQTGAEEAACTDVQVHFPYDSAELGEDDRKTLDGVAKCLMDRRITSLLIQGHADERGTQEYNLALGERRAITVMKMLALLGVSRDEMRTLSYGKNHPLCADHSEGCWAKNRRAEFIAQGQ